MSKKMLNKTIVAFVLLAIFVPLALIGDYVVIPTITVIDALAAYEINSLFHKKVNWLQIILTTLFGVSLLYLPDKYLLGTIIIWLFILFVIYIFSPEENNDFVAYTFLLSSIVCIGMRTIVVFYDQYLGNAFFILIYIGIASFGCDTAAYFCGSFFGKNKLAPKISPNKTWEGSIGGYIVGMIISMIFGLLVVKQYPKSLIIISSLILPLISQIGDLSFSAVKRKFGVKDFGSLIPGHGGMLDRIDSLIFALLCFQTLLMIWG